MWGVHVFVTGLLAVASATRFGDEVAVTSIPRGDNEWYALSVPSTDTQNAKFYGASFDASNFLPASAPFGLPDPQNRWECPMNKESAIHGDFPANSDLLLRRQIDLPAGVSSLDVRITAFQKVAVYINGEPVSGTSTSPIVTPGGLCAAKDNVVLTIPDRFIRTGGNLIAVRVYGATALNYFDMQLRAFYLRPVGDAGSVYTWGKGYYGVLGNGYEDDSFTPSRILDLKELKGESLKDMALGVSHTALLTESGRVFAWGRGVEGQLGINEEYTEVPMEVLALNTLGKIVAITAGSLHTLALDTNGRVYCFGDNSEGQCGLGDENTDSTISEPVLVRGLENEVISFIGAKDTNCVAITDEGKVFMWGNGERDATYVDAIPDVKQLAVGSSHALVLTSGGKVYSIGSALYGQLGLGRNTTQATKFTLVQTLNGVTIARVAAGSDNSFAITTQGKLFVWGAGGFGKSGLGVWDSRFEPTEVTALSSHVVRRVGAGMTSTVFLTDKGLVFQSGAYLRDGTHTLLPTFWASASDKYFTEVFASHLHYAAMTRPSRWQWTQVAGYYEGTMTPQSQ